MSKIIGVLGGMGPYATVDLFRKILDQYQVQGDRDYPQILIYNNSHVPSRTRAILYDEESPLPYMIEGCHTLERGGADFIAIPCNSAHAWYDEIAAKIHVPLINMLDCVREEVLENAPRKLGVISAEVVIRKRLYNHVFEGTGIEIVLADDNLERKVREVIDDVKLNRITPNTVQKMGEVVDDFQSQDVDGLILGCSEIPLVLTQKDTSLPLYDSTEILAQKVADLAR